MKDAVGGIFFYPKAVQQRVIDLGLTTPEIIKKRKVIFFTVLLIGVLALPVIFIGVWNGVSDFRTAYIQAVLFLEIMNWYDGIFVDSIWVRFSKFWLIKGAEDLEYVKSIKYVLTKRTAASVLYLLIAAGIAKLAVLIAA